MYSTTRLLTLSLLLGAAGLPAQTDEPVVSEHRAIGDHRAPHVVIGTAVEVTESRGIEHATIQVHRAPRGEGLGPGHDITVLQNATHSHVGCILQRRITCLPGLSL